MLTSQLVSPINTDHEIFFEEVRQFYLSLKSFQTTKIGIYFGVLLKCYCIIKFVYVYQVTPNLTWIGISFFSRSLLYYIPDYYVYFYTRIMQLLNFPSKFQDLRTPPTPSPTKQPLSPR